MRDEDTLLILLMVGFTAALVFTAVLLEWFIP